MYWETIAHSIPAKYEQYSIELLKVISDLWIIMMVTLLLKNGQQVLKGNEEGNKKIFTARKRFRYVMYLDQCVFCNSTLCLSWVFLKWLRHNTYIMLIS